jgi:small GTP-binding protein
LSDRDVGDQLRRGVERAREFADQGLRDVSGSLRRGLANLPRTRAAVRKPRKKTQNAAVDDPAAFFDQSQRNAIVEMGRANILISGQTGVGKSTLINAILRVPLAEVGTGKPVTDHVRQYRQDGVPVTIFDTPGIELGQAKKDVIREYQKTIRASRGGNPEDLIHVAWYCIDGGQARVQDYDLEIIRALADELEVILVLTQSIDDERADALEQALRAENLPVRGEPIRTVARPRVLAGHTLPARGLEELVERTSDILPEAVRRAFINAQGVVLSMKVKEARKVVAASSTTAAAVGAVPIPAPDAVVLLPLQIGMLGVISAIFGIEASRDSSRSLITGLVGKGGTSLVGRQLAETLLKYLPAGAVVNAGVASAVTAALGEAYVQLCSEMFRRKADGRPMPDADMLPFLLDAYQTLFDSKNPFRRTGPSAQRAAG